MSNNSGGKKRLGLAGKAIIIIALSAFLFAAYKIVSIQLEYKKGNDEYAGLENEYVQKDSIQSPIMQRVEELGDSADEAITDPTLNNSGISVDFVALIAENPDTVAWIHFPNADISYPVMQAQDNDYYLKHTFKRESNSNGCIFIDSRNSSDFSDDNTIIYGHNMKSGAMFGTLKLYGDESFYRENPYFYILRPGFGADKYEVFSFYQTDSLSTYTRTFTDSDKKRAFLQNINELSLKKVAMNIDITDRIVTLVTCPASGASSDTRFIVHAKPTGK